MLPGRPREHEGLSTHHASDQRSCQAVSCCSWTFPTPGKGRTAGGSSVSRGPLGHHQYRTNLRTGIIHEHKHTGNMESLEKREKGLVCVCGFGFGGFSPLPSREQWCGRWTRVSAEREAACPWGVRLRIGTAQVCDSGERAAALSELGSVDWGDTYLVFVCKLGLHRGLFI